MRKSKRPKCGFIKCTNGHIISLESIMKISPPNRDGICTLDFLDGKQLKRRQASEASIQKVLPELYAEVSDES